MNNDGQAVEWYQKAAEQGIASAFTLPSTIGMKALTDIMKKTTLTTWIAIAVIAHTK